MRWIAAIFIALLIIGYLQRKNANHPLNTVNVGKQIPVPSNEPTSGDVFTQGGTIAAGVCEPIAPVTAPKQVQTTVLPTGKVLTMAVPVTMPRPIAPIRPVSEVPRVPVAPISVALPVVPRVTLPARIVNPILPPRTLTPNYAATQAAYAAKLTPSPAPLTTPLQTIPFAPTPFGTGINCSGENDLGSGGSYLIQDAYSNYEATHCAG